MRSHECADVLLGRLLVPGAAAIVREIEVALTLPAFDPIPRQSQMGIFAGFDRVPRLAGCGIYHRVGVDRGQLPRSPRLPQFEEGHGFGAVAAQPSVFADIDDGWIVPVRRIPLLAGLGIGGDRGHRSPIDEGASARAGNSGIVSVGCHGCKPEWRSGLRRAAPCSVTLAALARRPPCNPAPRLSCATAGEPLF